MGLHLIDFRNTLTLYTTSVFSSTTRLQNIVHRRLQSGKMNTKPGADRWSSLLSVSTPLQTVNLAIFCLHYSFPIPSPFSRFTFLWPPWQQWFHAHGFAVEPFDHNAITCFPDLMPSPWSILCGPRTFCHCTFSSYYMICTCIQLCNTCLYGLIGYLQVIVLEKYYCHEFIVQSESFILMCAIQ